MAPAPEVRLRELGLELPAVQQPAGAYVPATRAGALIFTAGQLPFENGELCKTGKVADTVSAEEAYAAARLCALNALAAAAAAGFNSQPQVINGASELIGEVFGEAGLHARSAVGVAELPLDAPVEVELIVELVTQTPHPTTGFSVLPDTT